MAEEKGDDMSIWTMSAADLIAEPLLRSVQLFQLNVDVFLITEEPKLETMEIEETRVPVISTTPTALPTSAPMDSNEPRAPLVSQTQIEVEDLDLDNEGDHPSTQDDSFASSDNFFDFADNIINNIVNHIS